MCQRRPGAQKAHLPYLVSWLYTVSQKNDTDIAQYNINARQLILLIFGKDIAEWVHYRMVICCPTSPN